MNTLEAIILGVVQGLAEFLPISSSGHLQIAKEVLGVEIADNLTFDIMLHVATVLATIVVLWPEVSKIFKGVLVGLKPDGKESGSGIRRLKQTAINADTQYLLKLLLSAVPVALVGLLLRDELNAMLASPYILPIVGAMLILTAVLLTFANYAKERTPRRGKQAEERAGISYKDAFIIGLAQAVAAMPGLSRSGTTIATGLLLGDKKAAVAQFSFLMIIVPILGEALLDVVRGDFSGGLGVGFWPLVAGFLAAFAVGCAACKFMIEMVKRSKLIWFAVYCAVVGVATIIYYFV